jgi:hypothetical protein
MKQYVLTPDQLQVISFAEETVETPLPQLAVTTRLLPEHVKRAVDRLAYKGLVRIASRQVAGVDPGVVMRTIILTEDGRHLRSLVRARGAANSRASGPSTFGTQFAAASGTIISSGGTPGWLGITPRTDDLVLILPNEDEPDNRSISEIEVALDQALGEAKRPDDR